MKMSYSVVYMGALSLLIACAESSDPPSQENGPGVTKLDPPSIEQGGAAPAPSLVQTSVLNGTTNAGVLPVVVFGATDVFKETVDDVRREFQARTRFVCEDGTAAPVEIAVSVNVDAYDPFTFNFEFAPTSELQMDRWCMLEVQAGVIPVIHETAEIASARRHATYFFTGSAPRVARISRKTAVWDSMHIVFSEPVELGTLVNSLDVLTGGRASPGCVRWMDSCVRSDSSVVNSGVDYVFATADATGLPSDTLELRIGGALQGSGRTVEAARAALGERASEVVPLSIAVTGTAWQGCDGGKCWHAADPRSPAFGQK